MSKIRAWVAAHKKATAMLLGLVFACIPAELLDEAAKQKAIAVILAFILGQGVADLGKEAAKIDVQQDVIPPGNPVQPHEPKT